MNVLLLEPGELVDGAAVVTGRRAEHVRDVLGKNAGETLRVGVLGGRLGEGTLLTVEADRIELRCTLGIDPPPASDITLVLALPRPPVLRRVLQQDLEPDPTTGQRRLRRGVAPDRRPSLGDPEMRHGRKTRTRVFTGYKRHVVKVIDADVIVGAIARPANEPEHQALETLLPDVRRHGVLAELQIDRGYLGSPVVGTLHGDGVAIRAKAWTTVNGDRFPKQAFAIDLAAARVRCPADQIVAIPTGARTVHFAAGTCQACALQSACTTSTTGRSITIHPQEALLQRLRVAQREPTGRAQLRQRTTVEHSLARVDQIQGPRARYKGTRMNTLDVRRAAVVTNLQRIARLPVAA